MKHNHLAAVAALLLAAHIALTSASIHFVGDCASFGTDMPCRGTAIHTWIVFLLIIGVAGSIALAMSSFGLGYMNQQHFRLIAMFVGTLAAASLLSLTSGLMVFREQGCEQFASDAAATRSNTLFAFAVLGLVAGGILSLGMGGVALHQIITRWRHHGTKLAEQFKHRTAIAAGGAGGSAAAGHSAAKRAHSATAWLHKIRAMIPARTSRAQHVSAPAAAPAPVPAPVPASATVH